MLATSYLSKMTVILPYISSESVAFCQSVSADITEPWPCKMALTSAGFGLALTQNTMTC
jgi:hypothetical protein